MSQTDAPNDYLADASSCLSTHASTVHYYSFGASDAAQSDANVTPPTPRLIPCLHVCPIRNAYAPRAPLTVPKGGVDDGETTGQAAAREACEEGMSAQQSHLPVSTQSADRRLDGRRIDKMSTLHSFLCNTTHAHHGSLYLLRPHTAVMPRP